ncbi:hypothetical protein KFL_010950020 [Klebsormidium nitens]|uniref:PTC1-like winged helix-turn-helix domain-containing protein n=1 Tax=Klebsormidium nitens TaxID=105231 RepID=A0A1Y1IT03_KLENI|nr:hypothetical protein KFL_010950020 [Klebsormidium nitens]|eukprot:GAQ92689.1 hypothetical protein KFL_010950020 [Klebsormidium nitens]
MAHGWSTNGPKGDQKHYERQSVPGPKQNSVREPEYNSDGERVDPSYTLKGGKNQRRLRDIDDGMYGHAESDGTRGAARKLYECVMSHLGFSQEDFLSGKREELSAKRKAERTPAEVEAAQATKKAKRWRHRQRKKEEKATEQVGEHARKSTVEASRTQSGLIEDVPLSALPPHALASPALAPAPASAPANAPAPADAPATPARVPIAPTGADLVLYDGGSRESLDLSNERWKILEAEDEASPCSSRDGPCNEAPRSGGPFQRAQFQLVDLMAGLRPGVRLERDPVRETTRSTIRDTGLLDYVLKASRLQSFCVLRRRRVRS